MNAAKCQAITVNITGFAFPPLVLVHMNEPEVFAKTHSILLPKDYIRYKMFDEFSMEISDAYSNTIFNRPEWC